MSTNALAIREEETRAVAAWTPTFTATIAEAVARVEAKREFHQKVMRKDEHYGVIPGGSKDTLLKPGAELLLSAMSLCAELTDEVAPVKDWMGAQHGGEAFLEYRRVCRVFRQVGPQEHERVKIAQASGSCNSWEKKYRYRDEQRRCPNCTKTTLFVSRNEGEGFYCWRKKDGCGATFGPNDERITTQVVGRIPNPDVADLDNTLLKMADKRAYVAATLLATGCSDIFTQDLEDVEEPRHDVPPTSTPAESGAVAPARNGHAQTAPASANGTLTLTRAQIDTAPLIDIRKWVRVVNGVVSDTMSGDQNRAIIASMQTILGSQKRLLSDFTEADLREYLRRKTGNVDSKPQDASQPAADTSGHAAAETTTPTGLEGAESAPVVHGDLLPPLGEPAGDGEPGPITQGQLDTIEAIIAERKLLSTQVVALTRRVSKAAAHGNYMALNEADAETLISMLDQAGAQKA